MNLKAHSSWNFFPHSHRDFQLFTIVLSWFKELLQWKCYVFRDKVTLMHIGKSPYIFAYI